jgi:uncharacterized membrane protein YcaP (DUF421 family)
MQTVSYIHTIPTRLTNKTLHMKKSLLLIVLVCISVFYCKISHAQEKKPVVGKIINSQPTSFAKSG